MIINGQICIRFYCCKMFKKVTLIFIFRLIKIWTVIMDFFLLEQVNLFLDLIFDCSWVNKFLYRRKLFIKFPLPTSTLINFNVSYKINCRLFITNVSFFVFYTPYYSCERFNVLKCILIELNLISNQFYFV